MRARLDEASYNRTVLLYGIEQVDRLELPITPLSSYITFDRDSWSQLRADTAMPLAVEELDALRGLNEHLTLEEVEQIYLPLSRLLNLHVLATQQLQRATARFLGQDEGPVPVIVGLAGSVAVGKSTLARVLRALLARWPNSPRVDLITTDGFLLPNAELERRGLLARKGFPESYDRAALLQLVVDLKRGAPSVQAPVYSHIHYDVLPGDHQVIERPDIVLLEGLNVLQHGQDWGRAFVSDFFDFSIYLDAEVDDLRRWYLTRFLRLRDTAFREPTSYFHRYAALTDSQAQERALTLWREINEVNLVQNILPTRERATLILHKGPDHRIQQVRLRRR